MVWYGPVYSCMVLYDLIWLLMVPYDPLWSTTNEQFNLGDFQKETRSIKSNFVSNIITSKSIIGIVFFNPSNTIYVKTNSATQENDSNDTLACDDNTHKVSQCTPSLFMKIISILCMVSITVNLALGAITQGWSPSSIY